MKIKWNPILPNQFWAVVGFENYNMAHILTSSHLNWDVKWPGGVISLGPLCTLQKLREEEQEGWFNIAKKITCPWQTMRRLRMRENNSELWNLFPELLNCFFVFYFFYFIFFTHFVWIYLVVKMRFERPTCCICRETFCIQVSCSNNSAISPTESLSASSYTTSKIDYKCHFFTQQFIRCTYTVCGSQ